MEIRRLVKSGAASHTVSLPKGWIDRNKLNRGDLVYIMEKSDNELLITPESREKKKEVKETTINIDSKDLETIQREITSAYINNSSSIIIMGQGLDKVIKDVRKVLHDFVAMEITEQTSTRIVASDLLNLNEISIDKTLRRMDMIIRSVLSDSIKSIDGKNMYESVYYRDFDINKLYFLMYRILKSALNNPKIATTFNITNTQALYRWHLAVSLENIADDAKEICQKLNDLSKSSDLNNLKMIYSKIEKSYLDVIKAFFNNDLKLAQSVASSRRPIIDLCSTFSEKNNKRAAIEIVENLKDMVNHIQNIARIVIDGD